MLEAFRLGGFGMIPTFLFGVLSVVAALRYAAKPEQRQVPVQLALAGLTLSAGGLGFVTGMIKSFMAVGEVPADQRWIWLIGAGESLHNIALALALVTIGAMASTVGAVRFARAQ